jgi:hypothetical protein
MQRANNMAPGICPPFAQLCAGMGAGGGKRVYVRAFAQAVWSEATGHKDLRISAKSAANLFCACLSASVVFLLSSSDDGMSALSAISSFSFFLQTRDT